MAGDPRRVTGKFGGGAGTLSQFIAPSLGLNFDESTWNNGFGNDRVGGQPIMITFDVPMNTASVSFLYQDPNEDGRGNAAGVRTSSGLVEASFYGPDGNLVAHTTGLTEGAQGGLLGANFQGNNPQGAVRASGPIARMEIAMPRSYGSESWLSGAIPAGLIDYPQLAINSTTLNTANQAALDAAATAKILAMQADSDAAAAAAALAKSASMPGDSGTAAYAADAAARATASAAGVSVAIANAATAAAAAASASANLFQHGNATPFTDFVGQPTPNMMALPVDSIGTSPTFDPPAPATPLTNAVGHNPAWPVLSVGPDLAPVAQGGAPGAAGASNGSGLALLLGVGVLTFLMGRRGR